MEINSVNLKDINISQVAKEAGCSWDTARNHLEGNLKGYSNRRPSKVDKVSHIIEEIFENPNITVKNKTGMYSYIKREYPQLVDFEANTFNYYLNKHYHKELKEKKNHNYTTRFETAPAFQCQFDYKENFKYVLENGLEQKSDVGVIIWSNSRHVYREVIRDRTTEATIEFLVNAFESYGGVPKEMIIDNPKALVSQPRNSNEEYIINEKFEHFAKECNIMLKPAKPYRPETKGKVERTMRQIEDVEYYNGKIKSSYDFGVIVQKLTNEHNMRVHGTTGFTPNILIKKEKENMHPLPNENILSKYKLTTTKTYNILKDGTFKYKEKYYSVPYDLVSKTVEVIITENKLHIYYNKYYITTHIINDDIKINIKDEHKHPSVLRNKTISDDKEVTLTDEVDEQSLKNIQNLGRT